MILRRAMGWLLWAAWVTAGCGDSGVSRCASSEPIVQDLTLKCGLEDGTSTKVSLCINATVPCLRGATHATLITSVGTVGGEDSGTLVTVFLAPTQNDIASGILQGETELVIPEGHKTQLITQVGNKIIVVEFPNDTCQQGNNACL